MVVTDKIAKAEILMIEPGATCEFPLDLLAPHVPYEDNRVLVWNGEEVELVQTADDYILIPDHLYDSEDEVVTAYNALLEAVIETEGEDWESRRPRNRCEFVIGLRKDARKFMACIFLPRRKIEQN